MFAAVKVVLGCRPIEYLLFSGKWIIKFSLLICGGDFTVMEENKSTVIQRLVVLACLLPHVQHVYCALAGIESCVFSSCGVEEAALASVG